MALGDGVAWDETAPTDNTTAIYIDDHNLDLRKGTRSRMAIEHEWPASQSATNEAGQHKYLTLQMQTTHAGISGTQVGSLYQSTVGTTGDALFFCNASTQKINISDKLYFWHMGGDCTTGTNVSGTLYLINDGNIKIARAYIVTTASGGDGVQVDINYDGNSIWTATSAQLILAPGSTSTSVVAASIATGAVTAGGLLTMDIDKVGTGTAGATLTVMVQVG